MAYAAQIRGLLLEEVLLFLLETSGYRTVEEADIADDDPLLWRGSAGIELRGRGAQHQIDAIADYMIAHPFSNPQRLLVEAKCYKPSKRVGIDVIRNTIGVLKDVSEHWVTVGPNATSAKDRFHYQSAVFSATGYTSDAEKYAFAHDIYLIPLTFSRFIKTVVDLIHSVTPSAFGSRTQNIAIDLKQFRQAFRNALRPGRRERTPHLDRIVHTLEARRLIKQVVEETEKLRGAALAMINDRFPVFLIPNRHVNLSKLDDLIEVEIRWDRDSWFIDAVHTRQWMTRQWHNVDNPRRLFSFDLPKELFDEYARHDLLSSRPRLSRRDALLLKQENLSEIQASIVTGDGQFRVLTFRLDPYWIHNVREQPEAERSFQG